MLNSLPITRIDPHQGTLLKQVNSWGDTVHAVSHLKEPERARLLLLLEPETAADVLEQIPAMLSRFFNAFYEGIVLGMEATPCECAICRNGKDLALKIVVHSGSAVFNQVGGFNKVSGPDVILAHRLLKNSVPDKEYLLMSEAAYSSRLMMCQP